jgi:hypothetical protein
MAISHVSVAVVYVHKSSQETERVRELVFEPESKLRVENPVAEKALSASTDVGGTVNRYE